MNKKSNDVKTWGLERQDLQEMDKPRRKALSDSAALI
jgi:hypothetical protein